MDQSIQKMISALVSILGENLHSIWLYGSVVLGDFCLGWSDIDMLALTRGAPSEDQARALLMLRQELREQEPDNPYYRSFEGIIADVTEYQKGCFSRLVYWGTSGQRITDRYEKDVFGEWELARRGQCVYGEADRSLFQEPSREDLIRAIRSHLEGIRRYAVTTDESLYSCGWLLDISRCLYTLHTGEVIAKTAAGRWALEKRLCPDPEALETALAIRLTPLAYKGDAATRQWLATLGPIVQRYADVLEEALPQER